MKAAKDAGGEYHTIPRVKTTSGEETSQDWQFWKSTSKIQLLRWTKPRSVCKIRIRGLGPSAWWHGVSQWRALASSKVCGKKTRSGRAFGLTWIRWIVCVLRTASMEWNVPGDYGSHGELFFFLIQKELATVPVSGDLQPLLQC